MEAENALKTADEFVKKVIEIVKKENPQQRFKFYPKLSSQKRRIFPTFCRITKNKVCETPLAPIL